MSDDPETPETDALIEALLEQGDIVGGVRRVTGSLERRLAEANADHASRCADNDRLRTALDNARKDAESISIAYGNLSEEMGQLRSQVGGPKEVQFFRDADLARIKESERQLDCLRQSEQRLREQYEELIYAVACKFPGESRHETALRYIRERESREVPARQVTGEGKG